MKKIGLLLAVLSFCIIGAVNAEELNLNDIAKVTAVIGGENKEIITLDTTNTYNYFYKIVEIDNTKFKDYIKNKYIVDNGNKETTQYNNAVTKATNYENTFKGLVANINNSSDIESWSPVTDNEITLTNLKYAENSHNGYLLAVAAVKEGDTNVYVLRSILESKSATTLGTIAYQTQDETAIQTTTETTTEENTNTNTQQQTQTNTQETEIKAEENPNTGLNDYVIFLAPISIILGSGILLRKSYA